MEQKEQFCKAVEIIWGLTPKEQEVAWVVSNLGFSNQALAKSLDISVNTFKTHLRHIYEKTKAHSRTELIVMLYFHLQSYHNVNSDEEDSSIRTG